MGMTVDLRFPNLGYLCQSFLEVDDDANLWGMEPGDFADAPDCDVMAQRFADHVRERGAPAEAVQVKVHAADDAMTDIHWFTVVDGIGVDWTARQFHNVRGVNVDASEIPSPLLFLWPGPYPIPTVEVEAL